MKLTHPEPSPDICSYFFVIFSRLMCDERDDATRISCAIRMGRDNGRERP